MGNKKILFVIDEVEFKYYEFNTLVTNFWFISELLSRGHEIFITTKNRLYLLKKRFPRRRLLLKLTVKIQQ
jgi:hypothetical protein